ncbi:MAG: D-alanyl-D-alanine carboxypeptidase family protein [Bacillota bacterium]|nr:D-alanyl-D-alanine carboxypeptidase family protein [Bacillota bacterium]
MGRKTALIFKIINKWTAAGIILIIIASAVCPLICYGQEGGGGLSVSAKGAVLIDGKTGTVLFESNSHEELPPASVTKIMSMLLVLEAEDRGQISMDDIVTVSERAAEMGGSQMFMEPGETHTVEELLKGAAMASANDACVALAEYVAGSEEAFVDMMNSRAEELGMVNTHFENTNGLPVAGHFSSAYDISMMSKELMKHDEIKEWLVTWMDTVKVGLEGKQKEFGLTNTNKLIRQYTGATGIKTGYTADAKFCLSGSAKRGNLELIGVILGAETSDIRFSEMKAMLDYGFALYDSVNIGDEGLSVGTSSVEKGSKDYVNGILPEDISILIKKEEKQQISQDIFMEERVTAPVKKGDKLGEIRIFKNGEIIETHDIVAETDVDRWGIFEVIRDMVGFSFKK